MIIVCTIVAFLFIADYWMNAGSVYRGVEVSGVSLGGLTQEGARQELEDRSTGALGGVLVANPVGGEDFTFAPEDMGVDYDVDATFDRAYSVGREGGIGERISDRVQSAYGTVEIEPEYSYDSARAEARVAEISSDLDSRQREASVSIVGSAVDVSESATGYRTNQTATLEAINTSIENMSGKAEVQGTVLRPQLMTGEAQQAASRAREAINGELAITGGGENWTISPAAIGDALVISERNGDFQVSSDREAIRQNLEPVYVALQQPAIEAEYEVEGTNVSVTPSQQGQTIQSERLLNEIEGGLFDGQRNYEVPIVVDRPELTTQQAEAMKPTEILGEYSTNYLTYDDTPGRVTNLQIGSDAVDGQLVAPGEVFSFNALASQYDYEAGSVIVDGQVDEADGGGLCQVSSTLYMAANYAGLDIVERTPHFAELPYIRPGFDATVWFGALDMQFRNNTNGYILIQESVNTRTGDVEAAIHGVPQNVQVEMESEKVAEYKNPEGKPTTEWVTYQTVTRDGQVEFDGVLHEDTYDYLKPADS